MAQGVSTAKFISSSKAYAKATVDKANTNKNRYLTKAEAAKLPKDLQDNVANHRAKGTTNGVVVASTFVEKYGGYVEAAVNKADKNGDGILTKTEAKALPADLRDNYANFAKAFGAGTPVGQQLQTATERRDAIYNKQLPASNAFGELAREMDSQLADGNIMTGVVTLASGKMAPGKPSDADLESWGKALAADFLKETDGDTLSDVKVQVMDPKSAVKDAGYFLAIGNAYDTSNPDNIDGLIDGQYPVGDPDHLIGIKELNAKLGDGSLTAVTVRGTRDGAGPGYSEVGLAAFLNTKTGEFVAYYGREGQP